MLFIRIDIPNFPKSDILIDWYRNSNISVTAGLVSSLKFLIEWYSPVEEDCIEVSFILIRASFHPDPDCPKNPRSSFNFGWSRFWYSEFSLTTGSISSVKDSIDCFQLWLSNLIENCWFWSVHLTRDSRITTYSAFIIDSSRILKLHFFVTIGLTSSIKVPSENFTLVQEDSIEIFFRYLVQISESVKVPERALPNDSSRDTSSFLHNYIINFFHQVLKGLFFSRGGMLPLKVIYFVLCVGIVLVRKWQATAFNWHYFDIPADSSPYRDLISCFQVVI